MLKPLPRLSLLGLLILASGCMAAREVPPAAVAKAPVTTSASEKARKDCASNPSARAVVDACTLFLASSPPPDRRAIALANRAWAFDRLGRAARALSDVDAAIAADANGGRAAAWNLKGVILRKMRRLGPAEAAFQRALQQLGRQKDEAIATGRSTALLARANLAGLLHQQRREDEAKRIVAEAHRLDPTFKPLQELYSYYGYS